MRPLFRPILKRIAGSKPRRWRRIGWQRNLTPIISRSKWGARQATREPMLGAWRGHVTLVVHHTVTKRAGGGTSGAEAVRIVDTVHADNRGGIGYGYLASAGQLFEGRGFEIVAAAAFDAQRDVGWNRGPYVHVAIPGDYTRSAIAPEDLRAIDDLTVHLARRGAKVAGILGHGDLMPTACPGARGRRDLAAYFGKRWKGAR